MFVFCSIQRLWVRARKGRVQARINYTLQGLKVMCIRVDNVEA